MSKRAYNTYQERSPKTSFKDIQLALSIAKTLKIVEASKQKYFTDDTWKDEIVSAIVFDSTEVQFGLENGDYVHCATK